MNVKDLCDCAFNETNPECISGSECILLEILDSMAINLEFDPCTLTLQGSILLR